MTLCGPQQCFIPPVLGGRSTDRDRKRPNKLVQRAGSVLDSSLNSTEEVAYRRMLARQTSIRNNSSHPLHHMWRLW